MSRKYSMYANRSAGERDRQYSTSSAGAVKVVMDIRFRLTRYSSRRWPEVECPRLFLPFIVFFRCFFIGNQWERPSPSV